MNETRTMLAPTDCRDAALAACYPEGLPDGFPVDLFPVVAGDTPEERDINLVTWMQLVCDAGQHVEQETIGLRNIQVGGVYAREVTIPKHVTLVGRVHTTDHLNIFLRGDLTFLTDQGAQRLRAPAMFTVPAGTAKLAFANEESVWINVFPDLGISPEEMIEHYTAPTFRDYMRASKAQSNNVLEQEVVS